jgi:hypothetical protein
MAARSSAPEKAARVMDLTLRVLTATRAPRLLADTGRVGGHPRCVPCTALSQRKLLSTCRVIWPPLLLGYPHRAMRDSRLTSAFCRSSGGSVRDTPHPEPGNPMATLGRRLPRIVCVRLGSARQLVELKVVRRLPSLWSLMEWAVVYSLG